MEKKLLSGQPYLLRPVLTHAESDQCEPNLLPKLLDPSIPPITLSLT